MKMIFNRWTRKLLLLELCFFMVGCLIHAVGLSWIAYSIWIERVDMLSKVSTADIFYAIEVWGLLVCLSNMLNVEKQNRSGSESSAFGAFYVFISIISLALGADTLVSNVRDTFSIIHHQTNIVSSNHTYPPTIDRTVVLSSAGTPVKLIGWLLFVVKTLEYTYTYEPEDFITNESHRAAITHTVARVMVVSLSYTSVASWIVIASQMNFKFIYPHYFILCYYLVTVSVAGCIQDGSAAKGTILSTLSVTFLIAILLDIGETVFYCTVSSKQPCTEPNPVYVGTMISSVIAGTLLWAYSLELWPFSWEPRLTAKNEFSTKAETTV